jgi:hypothetical protein
LIIESVGRARQEHPSKSKVKTLAVQLGIRFQDS